MKELIKQLMQLETLHQEYTEDDFLYIIDVTKEDNNTLIVKVQFKENSDKKEFEKWVDTLDDELFSEILSKLEPQTLGKLYNSDNYQKAIDLFKNKTKEVIEDKINALKALIN